MSVIVHVVFPNLTTASPVTLSTCGVEIITFQDHGNKFWVMDSEYVHDFEVDSVQD
jgi:hypothetical protein